MHTESVWIRAFEYTKHALVTSEGTGNLFHLNWWNSSTGQEVNLQEVFVPPGAVRFLDVATQAKTLLKGPGR